MLLEDSLRQMAQDITPRDDQRRSMKAAMESRLSPKILLSTVSKAVPSLSFGQTVKERVLSAIQPLRQAPLVHSGFKWAATFALVLLLVRSMPLLLLAPAQAELGVELVPGGDIVSIFTGGVWRDVADAQIMKSAVMVRTGNVGATLVLNDDGVLRLAPNTTLKLHDISDRPQFTSGGLTATLIRGKVWALGLLPPIVEGLVLETSYGTLSLNAGSVSIEDDGNGSVIVAVYDRGITLENGKQTSFLVAGERSTLREGKVFSIQNIPERAFSDMWVESNLAQDSVHRTEITRLHRERSEEVAGILPTSFLYSAKRIAEEVDVFFTLTHDGRTEKRILQANTRLNEALSLVKDGQDSEAETPLAEFKNSLVALASDENDNLVKYLITKQIADASASFSNDQDNPDASIQMLKDAVSQVGTAIPDTDLKPRDIEGYVLVDQLIMINQILSQNEDTSLAVSEYAEIRPYIESLLADTGGAHPLLQKEARSLLVTTSSLLRSVSATNEELVFAAMTADIEKYLPPEPENVLVSEADLARQVQEIMKRMFIFRQPISRYNQLLAEMRDLENNPNRGTLLRRLKSALPVGLGEYVNTEIQKLGDELKAQR